MLQTIPCRTFVASLVLVAIAVGIPALAADAAKATRPQPIPKVDKLTVFPGKLELLAKRDSRRLIVSGTSSDGRAFDLSSVAKLKAVGDQVTIDGDGFVVPHKKGAAKVVVTVGGHSVEVPVLVNDVSDQPVSFIREVVPVIGKSGCNIGTCHGNQKGQNGFKLSLRGYDPLYDYSALIDDLSGRRFNRSQPAQSLILLKPTQGVPHAGGFLFDEQSRQYALINQWIAEGCKFDTVKRVSRIEVFPTKPLLETTESHQQLIVIAHYADGTSRDVTRDAIFGSSDFEVATVGETGRIEAVRRGEAAALFRYEGQYAAAPIAIIGDREGFAWKPGLENNYIDALINQKLQRMKILPSGSCTDAEFLRRISIDMTGMPPTLDQVKAFLADKRPMMKKREAKREELINSAAFVDHWTLKWSDLLLSNSKFITP
ncbi:MAG: DUF1549 domain-containing protein, partial [Planctomycetaceae bacterium]